jgi:mannose-1-phosphate guanylyltransferase
MSLGSVLFAAGHGTRLRPLTERLPKAAVPLLDVPLGAFGLAALLRRSAPVGVNLAHHAELVRAALEPWARGGGVEFFQEAPEPFGTAGTLAALRDRLAPTVLTWNADVVCTVDLEALLLQHLAEGAAMTLVVVPAAAGADVVVRDGRVTRLFDRRKEKSARGHLFAGIAALSLDRLDRSIHAPAGLTEAVLGPLVRQGDVAAFEHTGYFADVGTPQRYLLASLDLLEGRGPPPPAAWPGRRVTVEGAWAYVGPGADVQGSIGPGAVLLAGSVVARGARVEGAVVWTGETVPAGTEVKGTVYAPSLPRSGRQRARVTRGSIPPSGS